MASAYLANSAKRPSLSSPIDLSVVKGKFKQIDQAAVLKALLPNLQRSERSSSNVFIEPCYDVRQLSASRVPVQARALPVSTPSTLFTPEPVPNSELSQSPDLFLRRSPREGRKSIDSADTTLYAPSEHFSIASTIVAEQPPPYHAIVAQSRASSIQYAPPTTTNGSIFGSRDYKRMAAKQNENKKKAHASSRRTIDITVMN